MSMNSIEREILNELKNITGRPKLTIKDIQEWSTSEEAVKKNLIPDDEDFFHCPGIGVWVALKKEGT